MSNNENNNGIEAMVNVPTNETPKEVSVQFVLQNNIDMLNTFEYKNNDEVARFGVIVLTVIKNTKSCIEALNKATMENQAKNEPEEGVDIGEIGS